MPNPVQISVPTFEPEQDSCPFCEGDGIYGADHRHRRAASSPRLPAELALDVSAQGTLPFGRASE